MRIPKFAFVLLVAGIVALASSLAMVKVHAHSQGTVMLLKVQSDSGDKTICALSTVDRNYAECSHGFTSVDNKSVGYNIYLLGREGDRVELGVRTTVNSDIEHAPQKQYWFEPGETLKVDVAGVAPLSVTGDWTDHMLTIFEKSEHSDLDPGLDKLRIVSPILLRGKEVVGDLEGFGAETTPGEIGFYLPGQGLYEISILPQEGAVEGHAKGNRIDFNMDGQSYAFVTGMPITRSEKIWILHTPNYKPKEGDPIFFANGKLSHPLVNANQPK